MWARRVYMKNLHNGLHHPKTSQIERHAHHKSFAHVKRINDKNPIKANKLNRGTNITITHKKGTRIVQVHHGCAWTYTNIIVMWGVTIHVFSYIVLYALLFNSTCHNVNKRSSIILVLAHLVEIFDSSLSNRKKYIFLCKKTEHVLTLTKKHKEKTFTSINDKHYFPYNLPASTRP